jgi:hypothetical protein
MIPALVDRLAARQNADGGWGAAEGAASNAECTALAMLAFASSPESEGGERVAAGERWLLSHQVDDGSWRYADEVSGTWPTPIVLLALRTRPEARPAVDRGLGWLLEIRGRALPWSVRLREFVNRRQTIELDSTLPGWPWQVGTFSWVEPTAWALMALKAAWPDRAPRAVAQRIRGGEDMLLDRACPGGGWNYGNSRVLEEDLVPFPDTTALALLGLLGREALLVVEGFQALNRLLDDHASGLSLSLAVLSRRAWGRDSGELQARLEAKLEQGGLDDTRTLALGALARAPNLNWLGARAHE